MAQATIVRGSDKKIRLKLRKRNGDPYTKVGDAKLIEVKFTKKDGTTLILNDVQNAAKASTVLFQGVNYTAVTPGVGGNTIALVFNGSDNIQTVINAHNGANPTNQVSSDAADDQVVPIAGTATLVQGEDAFKSVEPESGVPVTHGFLTLDMREVDTGELLLLKNSRVKMLVHRDQLPPAGKTDAGEAFNAVDVIE